MKRFVSLLLVVVFCLFAMAGCGEKGVEPSDVNNQSTVNSSSESKSETKGNSVAEDVAIKFVSSLLSSDYKTALDCLGLEEGKSFLVEDDIAFYLPRSSFAGIADLQSVANDIRISSVGSEKSSNNSVTSNIDLADGSGDIIESVTVITNLNDDNKWVVNASEFYNTNYTFRTAGGDVKVLVNDIEVSKDLCTNPSAGSTGMSKEYTLPYVGKKTIDVKLSCDNYSYTDTLSTSSNNEVGEEDKVFYVFTEDKDFSDVFNYIKDTWNALYTDYKGGNKAKDELSYIASDADPDICTQIWNGFKTIQTGSASGTKLKNDNFNLTQIKQMSGGDTFWVTDDNLVVNFDYELTWDYLLVKHHQSTKRHSNIILSKEDGKFKIYSLTDEGLFTENNSFTHEW